MLTEDNGIYVTTNITVYIKIFRQYMYIDLMNLFRKYVAMVLVLCIYVSWMEFASTEWCAHNRQMTNLKSGSYIYIVLGLDKYKTRS